jgi:hypothetical protein
LVEDVGAELAIDEAGDEVVVGKIIADVAEPDRDEVGQQIEHEDGLAELRAAAEGEGDVGLAGGEDLVEAIDDGTEDFPAGEVVGDVAGTAFDAGVVLEEIGEAGDGGRLGGTAGGVEAAGDAGDGGMEPRGKQRSCGDKGVPKCNLGTRGMGLMRRRGRMGDFGIFASCALRALGPCRLA